MDTNLRHINFRSFIFTFITAALTCIGCYLLQVFVVAGIVMLLGVAATLVFFCVLARIEGYESKINLTILFCIVIFLCVVVSFFVRFNLWTTVDTSSNKIYKIEGVVDEIVNDGLESSVVIKKLSVNGKSTSGRIKVYIENISENSVLPYIASGDRLSFSSSLYDNKLINGAKINTSYVNTNIRYRCYVQYQSLSFSPDEADFFTSIRIRIKNIFVGALGNEYGGIADGMLTGDKSGVLRTTRTAYSISGLGHLLSVSGLHVGFLATMLTFAFKKMKLTNVLSAVLSIIFFAFYIVIADFSSPVLRAVIMFETLTMSRLFAKRYDPLSSLAFSSTLLIAIQPFYLFDVGFILSVGCVYSIILFNPLFTKILKRLRLPKIVAQSLSVSISVQFGIFPAMIYFFNEIQLYSIFVNVLFMPFICVIFMLLTVFLMLAFILPFFSYFISITGLGIALMTDIVTLVSKLPFSIIPLESSVLIFMCYPLYFFISRFFMVEKRVSRIKIISAAMSFVLLFSGLVPIDDSLPARCIITLPTYSGMTSVVQIDSGVYIVGDFSESYEAQGAMRTLRRRKVKTIYINSLTKKTAQAVIDFSQKYDVERIMCPYGSSIDGLQMLMDAGITNFYLFEQYGEIDEEFIAVFSESGKHQAYILCTEKINVLFSNSSASYVDIDPFYLNKCGIIVARLYLNQLSQRVYLTTLPKKFLGEEPQYQYSTGEDGKFIFDLDTGTLVY